MVLVAQGFKRSSCSPTIMNVPAMCRQWVMLPETTEVVFVASARSPRILTTSRSKVMYWRDAYPINKSNALRKICGSKSCGFKSRSFRRIFSTKSRFYCTSTPGLTYPRYLCPRNYKFSMKKLPTITAPLL